MRHHHKTKWVRVRKDCPCPICGKPDWCLLAADLSVAICTRVESDRPAGNKGVGWVHRLRDDYGYHSPIMPPTRPAIVATVKPKIDWTAKAKKYVNQMTADCRDYLAVEIGVRPSTITAMKTGWCSSRSCWTFPMQNAAGEIVGIRTRQTDGEKRSDSGSDGNGLFLGPHLSSRYLLIVEGPTDCATMIDCGYLSVIGRPSCRGGTSYIVTIIERLRPEALLLIPDRDDAGLSGFAELAKEIVNRRAMPLIGIDAVVPPTKDVRDWRKKNRDDLTGTIAKKLEAIKTRSGGSCHDAT